MKPNHIWHRTVVTRRDGTLVPLSDNWSLIDVESGIAVAQMYLDTGYQDRPARRVICRTINDEGVLADSIMTWYEDPTVAKKYAKAQIGGLRYKIKRKRTKEEILRRSLKK